MSDVLLSERRSEQIHLLTLNRPEQLNAMSAELCQALHDELTALAADRSCRAIVLTGSGRGFCAGVDLRGYGQAPGNDGSDQARDHFANQEHMSTPDPAAAPDPAAGDRRGQRAGGRVRDGADPGQRHPLRGAKRRLPGRLHQHRRLQLRHGGELAAAEADRGLARPRADADRAQARRRGGERRSAWSPTPSRTRRCWSAHWQAAEQIAAWAPWGVRLTKRGMWSALEISSEAAAVGYEDRQQIMALHGQAPPEAVSAFLEKRPAEFAD